ncbi:MAG: UPF0175 family protein [Treponema sp.]|nr:UPF0175 family protein [Treponema sp.]
MNTIQEMANLPVEKQIQLDVTLPKRVLGIPNLEQELRRSLAVGLYLTEKCSIGLAAQIAGMNRLDFDVFLGKYEIPISLLTYEDVMADVAKIETHRREVQSAVAV